MLAGRGCLGAVAAATQARTVLSYSEDKRESNESAQETGSLARDRIGQRRRAYSFDKREEFRVSHETHLRMQETAVKINEHLDNRGKRLEDVSVSELREICHEVRESIG